MNAKWWLAAWALALILLSVLLFSDSWENPFVLDDVAKIQSNPDLRSPEFSLQTIFYNYSGRDAHFRNDPSRPLTFLMYWACWHMDDGSPFPFHVLNTLLHALCSFFAGWLCLRLVRGSLGEYHVPAGVLCSLLFLVLPINAGTVIYTYGLSDVLAALFAFWIAVLAVSDEEPGVASMAALAVLFVLALAAKQSSAVIPAVVLVLRPRRYRVHVLLFSLTGLYIVSRLLQFGRIGDLEAHETYELSKYAGSQGVMILKYLALTFWPQGLSIDHAIFPRHYSAVQKVLAWIVVAGLTAGSGYGAFKGRRWFQLCSWGWLIFIFGLLPTSSLFPTTDLFVERHTYLGSAGLMLAVCSAMFALLQSYRHVALKSALASTALAAISLFSAVSWSRNEVYSEKEKLWSEVIGLYPGDSRARLNLSTAYLETDRFELAKPILEKLLEEEAKNFQAWANLGTVYHSPKSPFLNLHKAWECYQKVLELEPDDFNTLSNAGFLMLGMNRFAEAEALFQRALIVSPKAPTLHFGLGKLSQMRGQREPAAQHFREALRWDPAYNPAEQGLRELQVTR